MSIRSMTGYGRAEVDGGRFRISVEFRSVNGRYLDLSFRLPRELQNMEGRLKELIQERMERGRISVTVNWDGALGGRTTVTLDEEVADAYFAGLSQLKERYHLSGPIELSTMASFPEILRFGTQEWDTDELTQLVESAATRALDDLARMKAEEGVLLAVDLRKRAEILRESLARVSARLPVRVEEGASGIRERLGRLLGDREFPQDRLAAEVALLADRLDCTEECVRFGIHVDQFLKYLSEGGAAGRRLNFLLQELGREVNTIGSKANDTLISHEVVLLKEELERIREQVQNVE